MFFSRLGNFVKLVDQLIVEHMFHVCKTQVMTFVEKVLSNQQENREGLFRANLVFNKQGKNIDVSIISGCNPPPPPFSLVDVNTYLYMYILLPYLGIIIVHGIHVKLFFVLNLYLKVHLEFRGKECFFIYRNTGYFPDQREVYHCPDEHIERNSLSALFQGDSHGWFCIGPRQ